MKEIIHATGLVKRYGEVVALDGLDLSVREGTIVALLGPNGAGKTTAVSVLTTLIEPDEGTATVAGIDVLSDPAEVRKLIGLSGQYAAVDQDLTGFENLDMIGCLYHHGPQEGPIPGPGAPGQVRSGRRGRPARQDLFGRHEAATRPGRCAGGGVAGAVPRRADHRPGPHQPQGAVGLIRTLVDQGATLLLTTQYLEEADRLADDVLVIDRGKTIAHGTVDDLKDMVGGERIAVKVSDRDDLPQAHEILGRVAVGELQGEERSRTVVAPVSGGTP